MASTRAAGHGNSTGSKCGDDGGGVVSPFCGCYRADGRGCVDLGGFSHCSWDVTSSAGLVRLATSRIRLVGAASVGGTRRRPRNATR